MLKLLGSAWGGVARTRAALYCNGWRTRRKLARPVVSVGALSVGGAGKTPTTALIAALLRDAGMRPAILSRGYRRSGREPLLVSTGDGALVDAERAGDEPFWMAGVLPGVALAVAARREQAARLVLASGPRDVFLLDDGFQHLRVARDADLLLVNPEAPFWEDTPLPHGRLREAPEAADRADAFVVVGAADGIVAELAQRFDARPTFILKRQPPTCWPVSRPAPAVAASAGPDDSDELAPPTRSAFAFAGIARPRRFFDDVVAAGVDLRGHRAFPDHHRFAAGDLGAVVEEARQAGAEMLLTTEKDAVRLPREAPDMPIHVWGYRLAAEAPEELLAWLEQQTRGSVQRGAA